MKFKGSLKKLPLLFFENWCENRQKSVATFKNQKWANGQKKWAFCIFSRKIRVNFCKKVGSGQKKWANGHF